MAVFKIHKILLHFWNEGSFMSVSKIMWKREDNKLINYNGGQVHSVDGNHLEIARVSRIHIGAYFCIASNNIPPSVSKRIDLKVQCEPFR